MMDSESISADTQRQLQQRIEAQFEPVFLSIENESHRHAGPAQDSHFKVTVVSNVFVGQRAVARHRAVYGVVTDLMPKPVHALALHTYTEDEWAMRTAPAPSSPVCRGGT